jgi:hypothetical protein
MFLHAGLRGWLVAAHYFLYGFLGCRRGESGHDNNISCKED